MNDTEYDLAYMPQGFENLKMLNEYVRFPPYLVKIIVAAAAVVAAMFKQPLAAGGGPFKCPFKFE